MDAPNESTVAVSRACAWIATPEGQAAIRQALEEARATCAALDRARRIDPCILDIPITRLHLKHFHPLEAI